MKIQITLISASDIWNVDIFHDSKVYAVAWIEDGSRPAKQKTTAKEFDTNPSWNKLMCFIVEEKALELDCLCLKLELRIKETTRSKEETTGRKKARRMIRMKETTGGKKVGDVSIPIKFLAKSKNGRLDFWSFWVRNPSGNVTGKLNLAFEVIKPESESIAKESAAPQRKKKKRKKVPLIKPEPESNAKEIDAPQGKNNKRNKVPVIKPEPKSNAKESAAPQRKKKKRKRHRVPLIKSEPNSNAKESAAPKRKKRKKVHLTTSSEFAPPTIDPPPLPLLPHPDVGYPQYPLQQPNSHQGGTGYTPSSGYPSYPPDYSQQAAYPSQPIEYPQQAGSHPYPPDYTQQAAYPYPPYTPYTPPDYPHQAGYPYAPYPPYTPQAAAPPPPPPLSHAGYPQYPTPGEQYPLPQPYPQQGGFTANSGYTGW
ncbi:hypothetical protein SUGI_0791450 [Cryptomeria japonica]|uniref:formin-like protein 20 n=1 Tax=Cryptomeria japonica TaxID=3369 RepID=UPI0024149CD9|nr:formin-like protein 20 [Cryptomeria japonica]GLJ38834.1 hypothetical protein SUGI_0791450 [Cryptomeria japonica]